MKVSYVNTSDIRGGAAIAAFRLFKLIRKTFPETRMLVAEKLSDTPGISDLNKSILKRILVKTRFYLEIFRFILKSGSRDYWFAFSAAFFGQDISRDPEIRKADIIHLHWINGGFLSVRNIRDVIRSGKPVVWSLHDMWAFTGGCHYPGSCTNYVKSCGDCYYLRDRGEKDLSFRIHSRKRDMYQTGNITFVAVSNWMAENARKSSLIGNCRIEVLPNPIDTEIYCPGDKSAAREALGLPMNKFLILSGAANLKDKRKGFSYLLQALTRMSNDHPGIREKYGLITFGKSAEAENPVIEMFPQSYLKDDRSIARLYQAADVFVLPSLEDNLPSTVMEALSCGVPVVAFNTGGIPDMVDHTVNGYLAELKNITDLGAGIKWVEDHPGIDNVKNKARQKVLENFSEEVVSAKYIKLYRDLLK